MRALHLLAPLAASILCVAACSDEDVNPAGTGSGAAGAAGGAGGTGGGATAVEIPGLSGPVQAVYDEHGLLHLTCAADDDCYAALGYFHSANRFFFMDFVRNLVRGRLGSLVKGGAVVLERDYDNRRFFSTREGEPLEDKLYADASPQVQGHLDAYARGVNAWIGDMRDGENGATLTPEYEFALIVKEAIRDWEPADSAAVGLYVLNDLSNNSGGEIDLSLLKPAFNPALAADLFTPKPVFDAFTLVAGMQVDAAASDASAMGGVGGELLPLLLDARARLRGVGSGALSRHAGEIGSNNWAVAPERTVDGHALLANDPHLLLGNPSIWFPVEIDALSAGDGEYHVAGSTFPGLPSVMVGHNESIGWGVTTAYWDLADVYVEQLTADGKSVVFEGAEVPILEKTFSFEDASTGTPVEKTLRWVPHHGPIVSEDADAGTALSVRWRGHDGGTDLDVFFGLARAQSTEEGRQTVEMASSASQNFVIVDKAGDIGWFPYAQVPNRPWASAALPPWLPLPGDGSAEWQGSVPLESLPQLHDPPAGAIATANADMTGASADGDITNDGQPAMQAIDKSEGTREQRILDLLEEGGDMHSVATMTAIQGDNYSLYGSFAVPPILAATTGVTWTADEQAVVDALAAWQLTCPTGVDGTDPVESPDATDAEETAESIGCTAFHATLFALVNVALADDIAAAGLEDIGTARWDLHLVARALKEPASITSGALLWDDVSTTTVVETRDDMVRRAITAAASRLAVTGPQNSWRWGRLHTLTLRSIYDNFGFATYNEGPFAAPGGLYTVNVANPSNRALPDEGDPWDFAFASGPSVRFVVEARADGPRMVYQLPGGTDLHRESDFYNNLLPRWLANDPIEFPFGPEAVAEPALEIEVLPVP
jgi:penicillin amidase